MLIPDRCHTSSVRFPVSQQRSVFKGRPSRKSLLTSIILASLPMLASPSAWAFCGTITGNSPGCIPELNEHVIVDWNGVLDHPFFRGSLELLDGVALTNGGQILSNGWDALFIRGGAD